MIGMKLGSVLLFYGIRPASTRGSGHELKFDDIIKGQLASGCPSNYSWHVKVGVYIRSLVPLSSHIQDRRSKGTLNSTVKKSGVHMNWMVDFFWVRL